MRIGERVIGDGHPPYVIAEIGVNHDGDPARAVSLVDQAAEAGADAVKLQYFETDVLMSKSAKLAAYQADAGETDPISMLRRLELPIDACRDVLNRAHERGVHALVTIFSVEHVDAVGSLGWDGFKTASPDIINRPLLDAIADLGRPMIVSTGASDLDEVRRAAGWLDRARDRLAMLQCVSAYPAPSSALGGMGAIHHATGLPVGYSDHTPGEETGGEAVRAGAVILEKHFTYDRAAKGPDHGASLEVDGLARYIDLARGTVGDARLIEGEKSVLDAERDVRRVSRQSIVARRDLPAGHVITRDDLTIKRPGTGIEPWRIGEVIGTRLAEAVEADRPLIESVAAV